MKKTIVAVVGASDTAAKMIADAEEVGRLIAQKGWTLVTGGLGGVMEAASKGANGAGGIVVGILPQGLTDHANKFVTIPIATNMGHARNAIIAHTADVLIAIGGGHGTLSEIAIALKLGKPVIGLNSWDIPGVVSAKDAKEAVEKIRSLQPKVVGAE